MSKSRCDAHNASYERGKKHHEVDIDCLCLGSLHLPERFRSGKDKSDRWLLEFPNAEKDDSNWTSPDDLERLFAIGFKPHKRKVGGTLPPTSEFQAGALADLKKQEYDFWYDMIAVSERSFIVATVDNYKYINAYGLFGRDPTVGAKRKKREKLNANHKYPGFVSGILIISRTLASQ